MLGNTKIIKLILFCLAGLSVFGLVVGIISSKPQITKPDKSKFPKLFIVQSGSMEPAVRIGSVILVLPSNLLPKTVGPVDLPKFSQGEIISFLSGKEVVTHRIVGIDFADNGFSYITKGDANKSPDQKPVSEEQVLGKAVISLPYVGYWAGFAKKPQGFMLLVIIPATIIIYEELKNIRRELKKYFKMLKLDKNINFLRPKNRQISRKVVLIPMFGAGLVFLAYSGSFFLDNEASLANNFQAGTWASPSPSASPTPSPSASPIGLADHIVISEVQIKGDNANEDFIELYNPTNQAVYLENWNLRMKASSGADDSITVIPEDKTIPAYGFFLWANYTPSVNPDIATKQTIGENNGIVLLDNNDNVVDQVGWGNSDKVYFEGTLITNGPSTNQSIERKAYSTSTQTSMMSGADTPKGNGYDSGNNANDFILRPSSQPQNSSSAIEIP